MVAPAGALYRHGPTLSPIDNRANGGLSLMHLSSLWRSLSGGQQNLFAEMKMFNEFNTSGGSVINLEVRWASAGFSSILSC